jgi:hypothetical protein
MVTNLKQARGPKSEDHLISSKSAPTLINEPQADWMPLPLAPFYCFQVGWVHSAEAWQDALRALVQAIICKHEEERQYLSGLSEAERHRFSELDMLPPPEWSFDRSKDEYQGWITAMGGSKTTYEASFTALGVITNIRPGAIFVYPSDIGDSFDGVVTGRSVEILQDRNWEETAPGGRWHRWLLKHLFWYWNLNFRRAFHSGAIRILARKNSVLAPFGRVTWDQWQFFRLDEDALSKPREREIWHDPVEPYWSSNRVSTATGPAGERLYSIYVAANPDQLIRPVDPEEKCLQWLLELHRDYPDRSPRPLPELAEKAVSMFEGFSKNAFYRCLFKVQVQTGNRRWSNAGRPQKSPQKSPQNK